MKTTGLLFATLFTGATVSNTNSCTPTAGIDVDDDRFSGLEQQAYIKSSNSESGDSFGSAIALSGDTVAVGAYLEDGNATGVSGSENSDAAPDSGAVYVYTRGSDGDWRQQAYIKASNTEAGDWFGYSVALSGDTLAVGAVREASDADETGGNELNNDDPGAGAVYIFTRDSDGDWRQTAYIKPFNTDANDAFGSSLALSGDTLVVGAPGEASADTGVDGNRSDDTADGAGAVYVFTRDSAGDWSQQAYLKASNTRASAAFGASVALSGERLAVGAPGEASDAVDVDGNQNNQNAPQSGAVYLFDRDGSADWSQSAYVKAFNTGNGDGFGTRVALSGDTLAVGAAGEDSDTTEIDGNERDDNAADAGAVYVYTRESDGDWSRQAYIKPDDTVAGARFGRSLALSGSILAVGADDAGDDTVSNSGADAAGVVYLFARAGDDWEQGASVTPANADSGDGFGLAVALSSDRLAAGAPGEDSVATDVDGLATDNSAADSGAAYVFDY
jgi:hypothetical protein